MTVFFRALVEGKDQYIIRHHKHVSDLQLVMMTHTKTHLRTDDSLIVLNGMKMTHTIAIVFA